MRQQENAGTREPGSVQNRQRGNEITKERGNEATKEAFLVPGTQHNLPLGLVGRTGLTGRTGRTGLGLGFTGTMNIEKIKQRKL